MSNIPTSVHPDMTMSELVELYYQVNIYQDKFSVYAYKKSFGKNVYPFLGNPSIKDVTEDDVKRLIDYLMKEHEHNTVFYIFRELRKIFRFALVHGAIICNPFQMVTDLHFIRKSQNVFTNEELEKIRIAIRETPIEHIYRFAFETGMRLTEIIPLTWDRINWERRSIDIKWKARFAKTPNQLINVSSKCISYYISPEVEAILYHEKERQIGKDNPLNLVFTGPKGRHVSINLIGHYGNEVKTKTGIEDFNFMRIRSNVLEGISL